MRGIALSACNAALYTVTDVGAYYIPLAVNLSGNIVGEYEGSSSFFAFYYSGGTISGIPMLSGGLANYATGINDSGMTTGWTVLSPGPQAVTWNSVTGTLYKIPSPGPSEGYGINNSGQVAGCCWGPAQSFIWNNPGFTEVLSPLGARGSEYTYATNSLGVTTGQAEFSSTTYGPAGPPMWNSMLDIANWSSLLQGPPPTNTNLGKLGGFGTCGYGINSSGLIVGAALTATAGQLVPFYYNGGILTEIGATTANGVAWGVNNLNQIVGEYNGDAFVCIPGGAPVDLNTLISGSTFGLHFDCANAINNNGVIVGQAHEVSGGVIHGFVLTPVP